MIIIINRRSVASLPKPIPCESFIRRTRKRTIKQNTCRIQVELMILINCPNFDKQNVPITQSTAHTCRASVFLYVSRTQTRLHHKHKGHDIFCYCAAQYIFGVPWCCGRLGAKSFSGEKLLWFLVYTESYFFVGDCVRIDGSSEIIC